MVVDTHVHISQNTCEPVEMLLTQMAYNGVEKALLVKRSGTNDTSYLVESMRRFPGRFSIVCQVDAGGPNALSELEHWRREGIETLRLRNAARSPGGDPLAIWKKVQELGMSVSVGGSVEKFATPDFARIVEQLPDLKFVFEHLAGMGLFVIGTWSNVAGAMRPKPTDADYRQALKLANYPNTYIKIHGMGEICPMPFPFKNIPPYVKMAYDAFGPQRMLWGSDWPPVVNREGYRNALNFTRDQLDYCSKDDVEWIFGKTALSIWKFL
jgi:L-fuconolactonase